MRSYWRPAATVSGDDKGTGGSALIKFAWVLAKASACRRD
jgi:hypothetical protein